MEVRGYIWASRVQAAAYLAGLIDGEGYVVAPGIPGARGSVGKGRGVTIVNTNLAIIGAAASACEFLGADYTFSSCEPQGRGRQDIYRLRIFRTSSIAILARECPVQEPGKLARLLVAARPAQPIPPRVTRDELASLYPLTPVTEIASLYGVAKATVYQWLKRHGLTERQGEAQRRRWDRSSPEQRAEKLRQLAAGRHV